MAAGLDDRGSDGNKGRLELGAFANLDRAAGYLDYSQTISRDLFKLSAFARAEAGIMGFRSEVADKYAQAIAGLRVDW